MEKTQENSIWSLKTVIAAITVGALFLTAVIAIGNNIVNKMNDAVNNDGTRISYVVEK